MVHGGVDAVRSEKKKSHLISHLSYLIYIIRFICQNKDIRAISFVGGNKAGEYIFEEGTRNGKRVQSNMGAKNHATILPDADKNSVRLSLSHSLSLSLSLLIRH